MDVRPLGATKLTVSALGLGTVKLGRTQGVKYPAPFELPSDEQASHLIAHAADLGINLIDTAPAYGSSESRLGRLLRGQRDRWTIVTKAGESFEDGVSRFDFTPAAVRASVDRSLARLQTDRVEILLIHSDGTIELELEQSGLLHCMRDLKTQGKIRAFGVSTKTARGGLLAAATCDVVMVTLNPAYRADIPVIEAARARNVGVLIKKALGSGHLAATGPRLRGVIDIPGVSSVILGTTSPEHLRENCAEALSVLTRSQ